MIGQLKFKEDIQELIDRNAYPRFSIFTGKKGIGKKTACKELAKRLGNIPCIIWGNKIDEIRELSKLMDQQDKPIVYCIPDYETMSVGARNSILKMCEEPPQKAYIVLTSYSKEIIIPTLLGRGSKFELEDYNREEMNEISKLLNMNNKYVELCEVPGDFEYCRDLDLDEFNEFMIKLWEFIGSSSAGNLLKVTQKIKLKEDGIGYDISLFINSLYNLNSKEPVSEIKDSVFSEIIIARKNIQLKYNKQYILDDLLLNIRSIKNGTI